MTIPGFIPKTYTTQDHIHLGMVPHDGSGPSGFGAHGEPPYTFTVHNRIPHFEAQDEFVRAQDGTPFDHILRNADLTLPIVYQDFQYTARVSQEELDILVALLKSRVYLVDSLHCPNGENHSIYVKKMYFADLTYTSMYDPRLANQDIQMTFKDMTTVPAL